MAKKGFQKREKRKDILIRARFALPEEDKELPLPSLEDVRDSEKTEFFSIDKQNRGEEG